MLAAASATCERCGVPILTPRTRGSAKRFCSDLCRKANHDATKRPSRHRPNHKIKTFDRAFNAFDGEGISPEGDSSQGRLVLLAAADGRELYHEDRRRLTTIECLEFLLDSPKQRNNVWFGIGYDVINILHDLPRGAGPSESEYFCSLARLKKEKVTRWKGYRITYIDNKDFSVTKRARGCRCRGANGARSTTCAHYRSFDSTDVIGFFQTSFEKTADIWFKDLPTDVRSIIARGKAARGEFHAWDLADVREYNRAECSMLVEIMSRFREALRESGQSVRRWNGAGAIASQWLHRHNVTEYFGTTPAAMDLPIRCAFSGGRIDGAVIGSARCSEGDIASAYPAQARFLLDMSLVDWRYAKRATLPDTMHGLAHVAWDVPEDTRFGPFFFREDDYSIKYPLDGEGWYHFIEVRAALLRFPAHVRILETWSPIGVERFPLREPIERDYLQRKAYKDAGHPANVPIKLVLNSIYGKFAQRAGARFDKSGVWHEPRFFNLFFAGFITAATRARISEAILTHGDKKTLAIATDGVFVRGAWKMREPDALGNYDVDKKTYRITTIGAGLYETTQRDGSLNKNKQRGHGGARVPYQTVIERWAKTREPWVRKTRRMFTLGKAIKSEEAYALRGTFAEENRAFNPPGEDPYKSGKRFLFMAKIKTRGLTALTPGERINQGCSAPYRIERPDPLTPFIEEKYEKIMAYDEL